MEQIREAADQKVDSLLADGLAVELRKKGKAHQKRLKTLLEKKFFTLPKQGGGVGNADAAAVPDTAAVPDEATERDDASNSNKPAEPVEDQVALLVFRQGKQESTHPAPTQRMRENVVSTQTRVQNIVMIMITTTLRARPLPASYSITS
jgi:hypothetical protein